MDKQNHLFTNEELNKIKRDIREDISSLTNSLRINLTTLEIPLSKINIILEKVRNIDDRLQFIENKINITEIVK